MPNFHDLVSRGTNISGSNQCYGTYDSASETGTGGGYINLCIHSGTIANVDANTVWYNYGAATAGTIVNAGNASDTTTATQSICPKGWTLPNNDQIASQRDVNSFSPVLGGSYVNNALYDDTTRGVWWGSVSYNGARRYGLYYDGSSLHSGRYERRRGLYIRCVSSS